MDTPRSPDLRALRHDIGRIDAALILKPVGECSVERAGDRIFKNRRMKIQHPHLKIRSLGGVWADQSDGFPDKWRHRGPIHREHV